MANFRRKLTMAQIVDIIEAEWSDDDDEVHTVSVLPPDIVDCVTDEEILDEDVIDMNNIISGTAELAGTLEYETRGDIESNKETMESESLGMHQSSTTFQQNECSGANENIEVPSTSYTPVAKRAKSMQQSIDPDPVTRKVKNYKSQQCFGEPKWIKANKLSYDIKPDTEPLKDVQIELFEKLKDLSPIDLFYKFFDEEVLNLIIEQSNLYASQKNAATFVLTESALKNFLGILLISGYHTLPSMSDYWSTNPTLGIPIVKQIMSRNKFREIKRFLHFSDNNQLDKNDKMAKIRPLMNIMNKKFIQFGIWSECLSVDEQMVPYFGRHSCKMYIRGKPIRFGYKLWCLCSSNGYLYSFAPYSGAVEDFDKHLGLGAQTVLRFAEKVEHPSRHMLFFDNFFSSYHLLCLLAEMKFCASGTVKVNRIGKASLKSGKDLPRGKSKTNYLYNSSIFFFFCRLFRC